MIKHFFIVCAALIGLFGFNTTEAANSNYKISDIPVDFSTAYDDKSLYLNIRLPVGLEIPDSFTFYNRGNAVGCQVNAKILDGNLFPDSNGDPLSSFQIHIEGINDSTAKKVKLIVKTVTEVIAKRTPTNLKNTSTKTFTGTLSDVQLKLKSEPDLYETDNANEGYVTFKLYHTK